VTKVHRKNAIGRDSMAKLLDTNVCIAVIRGHALIVDRMINELSAEMLFLSSVTLLELIYGVHRGKRPLEEREKVYRFVRTELQVLDFTADDAEIAGDIRGDLAARGQPIGNFDLLIAGQALARGLILVTANTREFERVSGLFVEDWTAAPG